VNHLAPARSPLLLSAALPLAGQAQAPSAADVARWAQQAANVEIIRDRWGIAHVYGKTDADAVFGMEYAQAEDDFNRIEQNYLVQLGRLAEAEGEQAIWQDLRARLYADPDSLKAAYARAPASLRKLMDAFADGLNYYLYRHPEVKPRALTRFEPWMALSFTEGSIGGDIERINAGQLAEFYGAPASHATGSGRATSSLAASPALRRLPSSRAVSLRQLPTTAPGALPRGSKHHRAQAHAQRARAAVHQSASFFFREESGGSDEGLNAYGAVTWGQPFVYQGFNDRVGWMHTSSGVDNIDEYLETVTQRDGRWTYLRRTRRAHGDAPGHGPLPHRGRLARHAHLHRILHAPRAGGRQGG
jgi:acyl-homoserine-lactone acylase